MTVNGRDYHILKQLGRGKGGYSYLAERDGERFVLKQIHHEPCDYYSFGNKIQSEYNDYHKLQETGIRMPRLLDIDMENERLIKEYIEGQTVYELVLRDELYEGYVNQVRAMAAMAADKGLNIDFFPTNFVVREGMLYYIDYECNPYSHQWNFENWGIRYWSKTPEFLEYAKQNRQ